MDQLREHLKKDTLPPVMVEMFAHWCIWEQARPALALVLQRANLQDIALRIDQATDLYSVARLGKSANAHIRALRASADPLGMSAAEAATFEFANIIKAADEKNLDAEAVAFFAARVCGWAGWAQTDFKDPRHKIAAEKQASARQERYLEKLYSELAAT
jgi:hypothetical protein